MRVYLDIETSYNEGWFWWTGKQYISESNIIEHTKIICICWKKEGEKTVHSLEWDSSQCDKKMLQTLGQWLVKNGVTEVVGHNSDNFDIRLINSRLAFHALPPIPLMVFDDTIKQCKRTFRLPSYSLANLAKYFGLKHTKMDVGIQLWHDIIKGPKDKTKKAMTHMIKYCAKDVVVLEDLAKRIEPYVKAKRSPARTVKTLPDYCSVCGGPVRKRGTYKAQSYLHPRGNCGDCGKWFYSTERV